MGPLRLVYNIASNKPPRYHDDPDGPDVVTSTNGDELDLYSNLDDPLTSQSDRLPQSAWRDRVAQSMPESVRQASSSVINWVKGPDPPRPWSIAPFLPKIQTAPIQLLNTYLPKRQHRFLLLLLLYFGWMLSFALVLRKSAFAADVPGYGSPVRLSCGTSFW